MSEMYSHGHDAMIRLSALGGAAAMAGLLKLIEYFAKVPKLSLPGFWKARPDAGLEKAGIAGYSSVNLGFSLEPTLLMYGVGVLVGPRVGILVMLVAARVSGETNITPVGAMGKVTQLAFALIAGESLAGVVLAVLQIFG